jgi:hypothetical protein
VTPLGLVMLIRNSFINALLGAGDLNQRPWQ